MFLGSLISLIKKSRMISSLIDKRHLPLRPAHFSPPPHYSRYSDPLSTMSLTFSQITSSVQNAIKIPIGLFPTNQTTPAKAKQELDGLADSLVRIIFSLKYPIKRRLTFQNVLFLIIIDKSDSCSASKLEFDDRRRNESLFFCMRILAARLTVLVFLLDIQPPERFSCRSILHQSYISCKGI